MQFRGFQCPIFQQTQVLDGCVFFGNFGVNHIYRRLQDWILMDNCHLHELNMWSAMDLGWTNVNNMNGVTESDCFSK